MKIYQNPYVNRPCYFIKEVSDSKFARGHQVTLWQGEWKVGRAEYYKKDIKDFPVVGTINLNKVIKEAVLESIKGEKNDLQL